jgi:hypothetical protein
MDPHHEVVAVDERFNRRAVRCRGPDLDPAMVGAKVLDNLVEIALQVFKVRFVKSIVRMSIF